MRRISVAAVVFVLACGPASGAGKKAPKIQYSAEPFTITSAVLPPRFNGNSYFDLYEALLKAPALSKGEFESTKQFELRQSDFVSKPLLGGVSRASTIAISLDPTLNGRDFTLTYDADTAQMRVRLNEINFPRGCNLSLTSHSRQTGAYVGSNAFGAKRTVTKHDVTYFCLGGNTGHEVSFPVALEKAMKIKPNLRVLLIASFEAPYRSESSDYSAATISDPVEVLYSAYILHLKVEQVWIYDWITGEIAYRPGMHQENIDLTNSVPGPTSLMDQNRNNLIHQAIWTDRFAAAELHVKHGDADINGRNKFGATPLHMAVWKKQARLVGVLVAAGADKTVRDNDGKTPLDDALDKGFEEIAKLLR
jgi:hypothetical protein